MGDITATYRESSLCHQSLIIYVTRVTTNCEAFPIMSDVSKAFAELVAVVRHLVSTHVHWNMDLSKDEALAKLEAAHAHALTGDVVKAVDVVSDAAEALAADDADKAVQEVSAVVSIVKDAATEVEGMVNPGE